MNRPVAVLALVLTVSGAQAAESTSGTAAHAVTGAAADTATEAAAGSATGTAAAPAATEAAAVISGDDVAAAKAERNCIRETGSRTAQADKNGCNGLPGDAYDKETIDRTGATTTREALRRLGH